MAKKKPDVPATPFVPDAQAASFLTGLMKAPVVEMEPTLYYGSASRYHEVGKKEDTDYLLSVTATGTAPVILTFRFAVVGKFTNPPKHFNLRGTSVLKDSTGTKIKALYYDKVIVPVCTVGGLTAYCEEQGVCPILAAWVSKQFDLEGVQLLVSPTFLIQTVSDALTLGGPKNTSSSFVTPSNITHIKQKYEGGNHA